MGCLGWGCAVVGFAGFRAFGRDLKGNLVLFAAEPLVLASGEYNTYVATSLHVMSQDLGFAKAGELPASQWLVESLCPVEHVDHVLEMV